MREQTKAIFTNKKLLKKEKLNLMSYKISEIRKFKGKFKCGFCGKFHPFKEYHRYHTIESWKANGSTRGMKPL